MNVGEETAGTNGKFNCQLAGKADHTTRLPGIQGPHRLTADVGRQLGGGEEKGRTTSSPTSTSRFQRLSRCRGSYRGQKSAPTAVRQVGRRENTCRPDHHTGTIRRRGRRGGTTGPGLLALSAGPRSRKTAGAAERRVGPKINSEK